jgi:outer membrane protein TolC
MGKARLLLVPILFFQLTAADPGLAQTRPRPTAQAAPAPSSAAATASAAPQAPSQPLTLQQAIERAITGNADLRRERIAIDVSEAQLEAARGAFDFRLSSDATFSRRTTPPISAQDLQGGASNNLTFDLGLNRPLETGGGVSLNARTSASDSNSRLECGTIEGRALNCTVYNSSVNLGFTHPLLRGFGADIAQANIRRQRVQRDQALLNRQMRAANIIRDVVNTYWGLSYATQNLAIRRSAVDLAREQLRVTQAQIDVGRLAPVDAAAVERAIGERQQEVLVSEQDLLFRTLDLRRLFGLPAEPNMAVYAAADVPQSGSRDVDLQGEIARALENNPQLRSISMGMKLSEIDIQTARSTVRPQLDFIGQVGATGRRRELSDALSRAFGFEDMTWSAGLSLDVPLENRTAEGQLRVARLASERARLETGDYELEVRYQVQRLTSMLRTASKRVELARATVGFANQNLEAEKARFSVGRSTNNDVLLRQQELKTAEIAVVQATVDLLVAETSLNAMTGELLERYRIVLKGM